MQVQTPEVRSVGKSLYFYQNDPNGMPLRLKDEDGIIKWEAHYSAFGLVDRLSVGVVEQPLRLQGQYFDGESGLCYNWHRYYDAGAGCFISCDPIGLEGGLNPYQFAPNVLGWIDPWGWKPCFADDAAKKHAERIIAKHGGKYVSEGHYIMPSRRAARQAASEIAGDLGSTPTIIRKSDYRGGPRSWASSEGRIGAKSRDGSSGWRDDSPGHPKFDAGPHVNAWNEQIGIFDNLHLDY